MAIIDHYISLESLRYHDERLKISKQVTIHSANAIPPLLYLTLVENAFKHGAGKSSATTEIKIEAETNSQYSVFKIENTCTGNQSNNESGIGLQNIRKQLRHHYHENFDFRVSQENNIFKVEIITPSHHD